MSAAPELGDSVDIRDGPFSEAGEYVTVDEGDNRRLDDVDEAVEAFEDYLVAKENRVLVLQEKESGDLLVLPHEHRWTAAYRSKTYARLKAVERHVTRKWGESVPTTMLTLTAPHNDESGRPRPMVDVLEDLKDGWDKARRVIRRETEGYETEYLAIYEPHSSGYPHLHVLVFGAALPSMGEKIREYWTERYVDGASVGAQDVTVKRDRSAQLGSPAAYVMKYLSKTLARESEEETTAIESLPSVNGFLSFSALMWATGSRTYSMSEGLSSAVKESEPEYEGTGGSWEYIGCSSGIEVGMYVGNEAEKLANYLRGSARQRRPPDRRDSINGRVDEFG